MTPAQRTALKKALLEHEAELLGRAARKLEPTRKDEARAGHDEDEQPYVEMGQAIASNRNKNDAALLAKVRAQLQRLLDEPDEVGVCQDCGDDIPAGRMKAMPWALYCVQCQSKADAPRGGPTRKKLTDFS